MPGIRLKGQHYFDSIAFSGGGGKGAYHIGVWKALDELDLLKTVRAVSGTSIGALNAVLFALGDYRTAKRIWYSLRGEDIFSISENSGNGIFSREGLERILGTLPLERLSDCGTEVYVNVFSVDDARTEWRRLNGLPVDGVKELLLATTALPVIYGRQKVGGREYFDGGVDTLGDGNVPVAPLYENGYRNILVSSLDHYFSFGPNSSLLKGQSAPKKYPDADITVLVPLEDLGDFISGTLNFSPSAIGSRMIMGYSDTKKQLKHEDVYYMKNRYSKINVQLYNQMHRLFSTGADVEKFIRLTNFSNINIEMPTLGGEVFYTDIVNIDGWRLQQHNVPFLTSHYRILDPGNTRMAWVLDPGDILSALDDYEAASAFEDDEALRRYEDG